MADITFDTGTGTYETDADWIGGTNPAADQGAILGVSSGDCTLDVAVATEALSSFVSTDYTGTFVMGAKIVDSEGSVLLGGTITADSGATIYCGGYLTCAEGMDFDSTGRNVTVVMDAGAGSQLITTNSVQIGDLTIDAAAADDISLADPLNCDDFLLADGVFQLGGYAMSCTLLDIDGGTLAGHANSVVTVSGTIIWAAGTITDLHVVQGDGSASWANATSKLSSWEIAEGCTVNRTANVYTKKLVVQANATLTASSSKITLVYRPGMSDFWDVHTSATITSGTAPDQIRINNTSRSNSGNLKADDLSLQLEDDGITVTQSGGMDIGGTIRIYCGRDDETGHLINTGTIANAGAVILGAPATKHGAWNTGGARGVVTLDSLVADTATANAWVMGGKSYNLSGTVDGTDVTVTANGANLHGGTIQNFNPTGCVNAWGVADGGGNGNDVAHQGGVNISNPLSRCGRLAA